MGDNVELLYFFTNLVTSLLLVVKPFIKYNPFANSGKRNLMISLTDIFFKN